MDLATFERVRAVLVKLDPEGLIRMGAPPDEYDGEAATLAEAIERGVPITPQYVRDVWLCSFGCGVSEGLDSTSKTRVVFGMPHRHVFDEIAEAIGGSVPLTKTTVLDGYYADDVCHPNDLLPDDVHGRMGRWTVTVTFEPEQ